MNSLSPTIEDEGLSLRELLSVIQNIEAGDPNPETRKRAASRTLAPESDRQKTYRMARGVDPLFIMSTYSLQCTVRIYHGNQGVM